MAGTTGLEPATSAVTGQRSDQLSYVPREKPAAGRAILGVSLFHNREGWSPHNRLGFASGKPEHSDGDNIIECIRIARARAAQR
jgi:hypothetical protein